MKIFGWSDSFSQSVSFSWTGRIYYFRVKSKDRCDQLVEDFRQKAIQARKKAEALSRFERNQAKFRLIFESTPFQCVIALLIFLVKPDPKSCRHIRHCPRPTRPSCADGPRSAARPQNFAVNAAQAQLNGQLVAPDGSFTDAGRFLDAADTAFTCVFTLELAMNAYAPFLRSAYNLVDAAVVLLSLLALGPLNVPVSILRVVRAFRVVRIFGRLRSLRNIVAGLAASVAPVVNAFVLMLLVVSICESPPLSRMPSVSLHPWVSISKQVASCLPVCLSLHLCQ